jgi:hypothetical protein
MQFGRIGTSLLEQGNTQDVLPSLLYPQLLGLSLGLEAAALGIDENKQAGIRALSHPLDNLKEQDPLTPDMRNLHHSFFNKLNYYQKRR